MAAQTPASSYLTRWVHYRDTNRGRGNPPDPYGENTPRSFPQRAHCPQVCGTLGQEILAGAGRAGRVTHQEGEDPWPPYGEDHHLSFRFVKLSPHAVTPRRATPGAVGYDLFTPISFVLRPKEQSTVFIDIAVQIPDGYYGQIVSKSGITALHEVTVRAGVVDPDYTGNIGVILKNDSKKPFERVVGQPIAQLLFVRVATPFLVAVEQLPATQRGPNGFRAHSAT